MSYIDLHCDTLMKAWLTGCKSLQEVSNAAVAPERLADNGCSAQFFAVFLPPRGAYQAMTGKELVADGVYIQDCIQILRGSCIGKSPLRMAENLTDLHKNLREGKVSAFLTLEDGRALAGSLERLRRYYDLGVRLISLTWNDANCLGWPNSRDTLVMEKGLTEFGIEAVKAMEDLGILIDVSHLSDGGFWDVARYSEKPFLASHSNCREVVPHPRNLTDEMIRCIADRGGIVGVNFTPEFLSPDPGTQMSEVQMIIQQLLHLKKVGGICCAAIGSDFDGMEASSGVTSPDWLYTLWDGLKSAHFTDDEIDAITTKNALRLIGQL